MMREKFNQGQITPQPHYIPKVRKPQIGIVKARTNASKTTRAVLNSCKYWTIERLIGGDWLEVCDMVQYSTGVYQIVGSKQKHRTIYDAMTESECIHV